MVRRILTAIGILLIAGLAACGPRSSKTWHSTTFDNPPGPNESQKPTDSDDQVEVDDQETAAPLTIQDEKKADIPAYQMPAPLREVLQKEIPQYVASESSEFQVTSPHLNISAKNSTMTFSGILKLKGRADEPFELSCKFDKAKLWICPDMFPTNEAVAKERRLQATVNCSDSYRCQKVGLELFVRVGDRTESQLFQSTKFEMRRATSGDIAAYEKPQKPVPGQEPPPPKAEEEVLTEEEFKKIVDDSNAAVEIVAPMPVPNPSAGTFSIPGIEKLKPEMGKGVANQAIGSHSDGHLEKAAHLDKQGTGYRVRDGADRAFGTDLMIGLIKGAATQMETAKPGHSPLIIADISKQTGGRLANRSGRHHASHQTGLDADIVFPSRRPVVDMWNACPTADSRCRASAKISDQLDEERLWTVLTSMTCAEKNPVIALFLDTEIKKHLCRWASSRFGGELRDASSCAFRTLRAMKYSAGHYNHVHVRLRCPGNADCRDATVSLGKGTGC